MSETNNSNVQSNLFASILLICSIIVLANVDPEEYSKVDHDPYYNFILMMPCILAGMLVSICALTAISINGGTGNYYCGIVLFTSGFIIVSTFMIMVWNNDPKHSVIFYKEFWTESAFVFHKTPPKAWAYVMSDVIIRIYSASITLVFMIIVLGGCCTSGFVIANRQNSNDLGGMV